MILVFGIIICILLPLLASKYAKRRALDKESRIPLYTAAVTAGLLAFGISVTVTLFSDRFCNYELTDKKVYSLSTKESPRGYVREMNDSASSNYTFWYIDGDRVKEFVISTAHVAKDDDMSRGVVRIETYELPLVKAILFIRNPITYKAYYRD